jgi:hypothetical protein
MTSTTLSDSNPADKILRQIQSLESKHASTISNCGTPADTTVTVDMFLDDDDVSLMSSDNDDDDEILLFAPVEKNDKGEPKQVALELSKPFFLMPKSLSSQPIYQFDFSQPIGKSDMMKVHDP